MGDMQYLDVEALKRIDDAIDGGDAGALFEADIIGHLATLKSYDQAAYQRRRARIKDRKVVPVIAIEKVVDERLKAMRAEDGSGSDNVSSRLEAIAREACALFHDSEDRSFADVEENGVRMTFDIESDGFTRYLKLLAHQGKLSGVGANQIRDVKNTLEALAVFEGPEQEVYQRVAQVGDTIYIDLGDPEWRAIQVDVDGWRIVNAPPVRFVRENKAQPMPEPEPGGDLDLLWQLLNIAPRDRHLLLAWALDTFMVSTPFALVALEAGEGAGKSTTQAAIVSLLDPRKASLLAMPESVEDLYVTALNTHLLSFNNLSKISARMQDALCCVCTGGGTAKRKQYTNHGLSCFQARRPIILNGIVSVVTSQDLIDRTIYFELPPVSQRVTESALQVMFKQHGGRIMGALLTLLSDAMRRLPGIDIAPDRMPRMADFAMLGEAVFKALGHVDGCFLAAYQANRDGQAMQSLADCAVAAAILKRFNPVDGSVDTWKGTVADALSYFDSYRPTGSKVWPASPKDFSIALARATKALRLAGIEVTRPRRRGFGQPLIITHVGVSEPAPPPECPVCAELNRQHGLDPYQRAAASTDFKPLDDDDAAVGW